MLLNAKSQFTRRADLPQRTCYVFPSKRRSLHVQFFNAKEPWDRNLVRLCQPEYLLTPRHVASPFPSRQCGSRDSGQRGCLVLRQFRFPSEIVQPGSVRISPCFRFSTHAPTRLICETKEQPVLSKSRQLCDLSACNFAATVSKHGMLEVGKVALISGIRKSDRQHFAGGLPRFPVQAQFDCQVSQLPATISRFQTHQSQGDHSL